MRWRIWPGVKLILSSAVAALIALAAPELRAEVAALDFGGPGAARARASVLRPLHTKYTILSGSRLLDACDELGIHMTRGRNLARAAQHIGAVAIIGGAVVGRSLNLAVYSGQTGQALITGRVAVRDGRLTKANLRKALTIVLKGLRRAPKRVDRRRSRPGPAPKPSPTAALAGGDLTYDPDLDNVARDRSYETPLGGPEENPLASSGPAAREPTRPTGQVSEAPGIHGSPRAVAHVGLGTWLRSLTISDPRQGDWLPNYSSGLAFALGLGLKVRPIAFFSDGIAESFYTRVRFQTMLALQLGAKDGNIYDTSLQELLWEVVGFDWNILGQPTSPHLEVGLGFGLMSFSIEWPDDGTTRRETPDIAMSWFLASLGGAMPLTDLFGAYLRFDYRLITGAGEIEDPDAWYGPSSTGGFGLLVGVNARYKGIVAKAEYSYTRYFYSFIEGNDRFTACPPCDPKSPSCTACAKKPAGGALDQQHGFIVSVGYSF
jgi:hypothetical protein